MPVPVPSPQSSPTTTGQSSMPSKVSYNFTYVYGTVTTSPGSQVKLGTKRQASETALGNKSPKRVKRIPVCRCQEITQLCRLNIYSIFCTQSKLTKKAALIQNSKHQRVADLVIDGSSTTSEFGNDMGDKNAPDHINTALPDWLAPYITVFLAHSFGSKWKELISLWTNRELKAEKACVHCWCLHFYLCADRMNFSVLYKLK
jgi:hypothetical protein